MSGYPHRLVDIKHWEDMAEEARACAAMCRYQEHWEIMMGIVSDYERQARMAKERLNVKTLED